MTEFNIVLVSLHSKLCSPHPYRTNMTVSIFDHMCDKRKIIIKYDNDK